MAAARYRVWISRYEPAHDLLLCSHHFNQHEEMILKEDFEVIDLEDEHVLA